MTDAPHGYAIWAVLDGFLDETHEALPHVASAFEATCAELASEGVTVRGLYDVSGLRAHATLMAWIHGPDLGELQRALRALHGTELLENTELVWSAAGVHRPAEFAKDHVPAFLREKPPLAWVTVYPFVRSFEWYLLPPEERGGMLAEHGSKGREHTTVQSNTVSAFALGDYEWVLALEADDPLALVDLMRDIRDTRARMHVREETPFYTGRLVSAAEAAEVLAS